MSEHYLNEIQRVQPKGPYHLFGFCFGGMVAFDMARRIEAKGERVAYLGMYNSPAPGTLKGWPLGNLLYVARRGRSEWLKARRMGEMGLRKQAVHLFSNARRFGLLVLRTARIELWRAWGAHDGNGNRRSLLEKIVNLEEINLAAAKNFAPAYVYPGRIALYLSPEAADVYPTTPEVGWGTLTAGGVDVIKGAWRDRSFMETVGNSLKQPVLPFPALSAERGSL
jgi:thioesterase domain-containing protein